MSLLLVRPSAGVLGIPAPTLPRPIPHVRVAWRPEQFNAVANPGFETNTTGWSVSAALNGAGVSITRITTESYAGAACGALVTNAVADSGVNFDFGASTFYSSVAYTVRLRLRRAGGGRRAKVMFGAYLATPDHADLHIQDLSDAWTEYEVRWQPATDRTNVELAVVTADDRAITILIDEVYVFLDSFSQIENGDFEETTTGWTAANSGSVARNIGAFAGSFAGRVTTTSTLSSGVDWSFGGRRFISGRTYRLRYAARPISGSAVIAVGLGDIGASDRTATAQTLSGGFATYTLDWTPSADRYAVTVNMRNDAAAANVFDIDEVEVYEATDEVAVDVLTWTRGSSFDGAGEPPGTLNFTILDPSSVYTPRNASSVLYGYVKPGKRALARIDHSSRMYPCAYGVVRSLTPDPFELKVHVQAEDGLFELSRRSVSRPFTDSVSYADARNGALETPAAPIDASGEYMTNGAAVLSTRQRAVVSDSIESSTFFDGTDGAINLLGYLDELNEATGSLHWCAPSAHAQIGWRYATRTRAFVTGGKASTFTIDEDFQDLSDVATRDESLVTRQRVSFQGYDILPPPDHSTYANHFSASPLAGLPGQGPVLYAVDATTFPSSPHLPYQTYSREEYGTTDEPKPETVYRIRKQWVREKGWKKGDKGPKRRRRWRRKAVGERFTETFVPTPIDAGTHRVFAFDFSVPMADLALATQTTFGSTEMVEPARLVLDAYGDSTDTDMTGFFIVGRPFLPRDEGEMTRTTGYPIAEGSPIDNPYVPGPAAAEGLADHITWRYGAGRARPQVIDQFFPFRMLDLNQPGDRVILSADRWYFDAMPTVLRSLSGEFALGGTIFRVTYGLEELPASSSWVTLDGSASEGIGGSAALAH
jgi:hypothetical protein